MGQNDWRVQPDNTVQVVNTKSPKQKGPAADADEPRQNYRGMLIAWFIIFVVLLAVVVSVAIIGVRDPRSVLIGRRLTAQDALQHRFRSPPFFAAWRGNTLIYKHSSGDLVQYNVVKNSSKVLFHLSPEEEVGNIDAVLSPDAKYVLERRRTRYGLRGATETQYVIHDVDGGHQYSVALRRGSLEDTYLQLALFSPAAVAGQRLAVVDRGDIYLLSAVASPDVVRLTVSAGDDSVILNGVSSWWYREALLGTSQALWFSPSGDQLMFVTFNDTKLDTVDIVKYQPAGHTVTRQMPYPKRNGNLTRISISICDVEASLANQTPAITQLDINFWNITPYLISAEWLDNVTVAVTTMSRDLTSTQVSLCSAPSWGCRKVYVTASWRWVNQLHPVFGAGGSDFVAKTDEAEESGHEIVEVRVQASTRQRHRSRDHLVTAVQHWDWQQHRIFYTGVTESRPSETHVFSRADSAASAHVPESARSVCLTCHVSAVIGRRCDSFRPVFSRLDGGLLALECSAGPVRSLHVLDGSLSRHLAQLDTSATLTERSRGVAVPHVLHETVRLDGELVRLEVVLPALWDQMEGGNHRFSFVLNIQDDSLELDWSRDLATFMVSKWDLVFVRVKVCSKLIRRSFSDDEKRTSSLLSHLGRKYPHLDVQHVTVIGEGFGGHSGLMALAENTAIYCGAVLWPIVDLDMYDAYHAERYVDTVDVLDAIGMVPDNSLYLIYGTGDPLFFHGDLISKKLVENGVLFYQQIYADEDVYLRSVRPHLLHSLEDFLISKCFPQLATKKAD